MPYIPVHRIWWLVGAGAGYGARYMKIRWQSRRWPVYADEEDPTIRLLELQDRYGYNPHSLVSITPGARVWYGSGVEGAVIYSEFGRVWLAAGDPLAAAVNAGELADQFVRAARRRGRTAAFVPATARFAEQAVEECGLGALRVGAAPYFDLKTWGPTGDRAKKLRAGVNQARRAGVSVETIRDVGDEQRREVAELCRRWLAVRKAGATFGWLLALDPFSFSDRKRCFAARDASNRLVGFLVASPIPARNGWYLEDVLREADAPQGTADLLVVEALRSLAESGAELATLGTCPLAADGEDAVPAGEYPMVERAMRVTARRASGVYNFDGLRRFKSKFVPTWWEPEYAIGPRGARVPPRVAHAVLRAIVPGGLPQLLTRHIARSIQRRVPGKRSPRQPAESQTSQ